MKLFFIDTINPIGHKELNKKIINYSTDIADKIVINTNEYFNRNELKGCNTVDIKLIPMKKRMVSILITQFINYVILRFKIKDNRDDVKIFTTFETASFIFARILFRKSKIIVYHHDNVDYLRINYIRFLFNLYRNNVRHFVFAEFIKERLITLGVKEQNISVITHPIPGIASKINENPKKELFIGLGYSSDNELFRQIIKFEEDNQILKANNIKLIFRSKNVESRLDNIEIINKHLSNKAYNQLYFDAYGIFVFYPDSFQFRYSGTILDGLRNNKVIIGSDIPIMRHFHKLYPSTCLIFKEISELFDIILSCKVGNKDEINAFNYSHADLRIKDEFELIINSL